MKFDSGESTLEESKTLSVIDYAAVEKRAWAHMTKFEADREATMSEQYVRYAVRKFREAFDYNLLTALQASIAKTPWCKTCHGNGVDRGRKCQHCRGKGVYRHRVEERNGFRSRPVR